MRHKKWHSSKKERRITGKNFKLSPKYSKLRPIWNLAYLHFFFGAFAGKNFYRHFWLFFTQKVEFDKKNNQKYIFDVKFPAESNPVGRIDLNIKKSGKMKKRSFYWKIHYSKTVFFKLAQILRKDNKLHVLWAKFLECHEFF